MINIILKNAPKSLVEEVSKTLEPQQATVAGWDKDLPRDTQHLFASKGVIMYSDDPKDKESPLFVNTLSNLNVKPDIQWMEGRLGFFKNRITANYVGRVYDDPKNLIIGDPEGISIKKYLSIFPDNWWGSLGFLTEYSPKKLHSICEMQMYYSKPVAVTKSASNALMATGLDFVDASEYPLTKTGGLQFREATHRDELIS